ncbi:LLM class flavin-dependent oxidoreductase [Kribbella sandramycini]|uniref:Alkanesulfonate monooxygenase SsuD/methylene tetrahydromethanopterin reductase-like flavin-dependent oxidoreductase (Luciferase family) n=1 Tax=Kribbella sandramycini TaxID=60450 RepID=A0A7Y4NZB3_9ACTN|nr:LLM class flavin-dependent oxidoreductase [Kribbella sandramycini]MBB6569498.1 alkanesulfonate monooxygenase SsuD/methylene tetrahydromethanopterin reductase-like flavin-dependent oxidoreductase (luciferase family) [Kribbella sandramycini]NOL40668.1 LLM class flavin-dependent oxidoreductase [Kribbella sandramycini]
MRFGITILPEYRWKDAERRWRKAEELGFDHAWTYDHLTWGGLQDSPWYGTTPTLTAAALVTSTIRLGTFVTSPNFRHPLALTREILALDDISDGRFLCGIGAGGGIDTTIQGGPELGPRAKVDRLTEFVELLDTLLTTDGVDHKGEYFETRNARTLPGCVQQPRVPFVMAANGPRSLRLAAKYGAGWVTTGRKADDLDSWFAGVTDLKHRLDDVVGDRPFDRYLSIDNGTYALSSLAAFEGIVGRAAALGFTDVITHYPRHDGIYAGSEDLLDQIAAEVIPQFR